MMEEGAGPAPWGAATFARQIVSRIQTRQVLFRSAIVSVLCEISVCKVAVCVAVRWADVRGQRNEGAVSGEGLG